MVIIMMKKEYIKPQLETRSFDLEDIILVSGITKCLKGDDSSYKGLVLDWDSTWNKTTEQYRNEIPLDFSAMWLKIPNIWERKKSDYMYVAMLCIVTYGIKVYGQEYIAERKIV